MVNILKDPRFWVGVAVGVVVVPFVMKKFQARKGGANKGA